MVNFSYEVKAVVLKIFNAIVTIAFLFL